MDHDVSQIPKYRYSHPAHLGHFVSNSCSMIRFHLESAYILRGGGLLVVGGQFENHTVGLLGRVGLLGCGIAPGKLQSMAHVHAIDEVCKGYLDDGLSGSISIGKIFALLFPSQTERPCLS